MKRLALSLLTILFLLLTGVLVQAHGGGDLIAGPQSVGPYIVSVWVNPPDPRAAETIHFTVGLASPADRQPILNAQIMVEMRPAGSGVLAASAPATTDQSVNKLFYETDIQVEEANNYDTTFIITGPEGEGTLMVPVDVTQPSNINWMALGIIGVGVIILAGWWRSRRSENSRSKRDEISLNSRL